MALNKQLEALEESDLQALVDNQVSERKTIEYKEALPGNADGDKKEFLADVSSFANASGGDLIYGIREQSGIPVELSGLELNDVDAEILRLENCIQTGIAPRLFRIVETHSVPLPTKQRYAIIIRIRKSWAAPHMVTFKNDSKFFSRDSRGKHQLDVSELRSAFLLSETAAERIRNFRAERISNVIAGETPVLLDENAPKIVLHIVPFGAFEPGARFNIDPLMNADKRGLIEPLRLASGGFPPSQYNFDGLLIAEQDTYVQVFRNGSIEAVDTSILNAAREKRFTRGFMYETNLLQAIRRYLDALEGLDVEPPLFVLVSFLGVKDYRILFNPDVFEDIYDHRIDRSNLIMPEVVIDSYDCNLTEVMKPIFDTIANAAKWPGSMMYDEAGKSLHTNL
jgi:Putative DNA-binding domain